MKESKNKLFDVVEELCKKNGKNIYQMCLDAEITPSLMTELKTGRTKYLSTNTIMKLAKHFGVSPDVFICTETED